MSTISIARNHSFTHKKAREVAEKIAKDLQKRFALDFAWKGDEVEFRRPGCSGRLLVGQNRFDLDVNLNFLLTPLRPAIEREIVAQFDELVEPGEAELQVDAKRANTSLGAKAPAKNAHAPAGMVAKKTSRPKG